MMNLNFRVWHVKEKKLYYRGYQKTFHVLLCDDDRGTNEGKGVPVKRAGYGECQFLQGTTVMDESGKEIFEGDIVKIRHASGVFEGVVKDVPDMFRSRRLHPLHEMLQECGIADDEPLSIKITGNIYESKKI